MERWIMNRLGFVNFWVYDTEEFPFRNGKLLLRGLNGSGKSITTQSCIPYILDGDRTPSRLDPFGTKDRKMEYYLLGDSDSGKEESTGYIYLEFKKPKSGQYRTVGIGLHARKGMKMNTWGFCILDGRRVGFEIMLYREAGTEKIPLDAKSLREQLGDKNLFTEKPTEYKTIVAKHIFDIDSESIADFEQLTNILIKTRSSKLASKENLKPEQLYAILNESLQTLSDDELQPMVDAMNKIEEIHHKVDEMNNVLREVKFVTAEYDRYNRYMLWKKAAAYSKKYKETSAAKTEKENLEAEISENSVKKSEAEAALVNWETKLNDLKRERKSLNYDDINKRIDEKENAVKNLAETCENRDKKQKLIGEKEAKVKQKREAQNKNKQEIFDLDYKIQKQTANLEGYDEFVPPLHNNYIRGIKTDDNFGDDSGKYVKEINNYCNRLRDVLSIIEKFDRENETLENAEKSFDEAKRAEENARDSLKKARKMLDDEKDSMIEKFYRSAKDNCEFTIDEYFLAKVEALISNYEGNGTSGDLLNLLSNYRSSIERELNEIIGDRKAYCKAAKRDYDALSAELDELKNASDPVPERSERRVRARKILSEKGIECRSFYECIDFKDGFNGSEKAVLEAELADMGILDALVVTEKQADAALKELGSFSDCMIISENKYADHESPFFVVSEGCALKNEVAAIIGALSADNSFGVKINADGYYKNGILAGHSADETDARFIGAEIRKKYRERQIIELTEKCAEMLTLYETAQAALETEQARINRLNEEYEPLTDFGNINAALNSVTEASTELAGKSEKKSIAEEAYNRVNGRVADLKSRLEIESRDIPYRKSAEAYSEAISELGAYSDDLQNICSLISDKKQRIINDDIIGENIDELESDIDNAQLDLKNIETSVHGYEETIRLCDEFLNRPENMDIAKRAAEINNEIDTAEDNIENAKIAIEVCKHKIESASGQLEKSENNLRELIEEETLLAKYLTEEYRLGLVIEDKELTLTQCVEIAEKSVFKEDVSRSEKDIQKALFDAYNKHLGSTAAEYNPTNNYIFDADTEDRVRERSIIELTWQGKKIPPAAFEAELRKEIDECRLYLKEGEEKMFTETLMDTVSKKLYYRISNSRKWVASMAELMEDINTSMKLAFSLKWNPKKYAGTEQLEFKELYSILGKSKELIRPEDYEKLSSYFNEKIEFEKRQFEERGEDINYSELVKNVLDYRKWFEFRLLCRPANADKFTELTVSRFNTFSGGERALSLYIPLFAAVAAQYEKAGEQAPKILALDEAFAGVDDSNISEMFGLLEKLGFGYIVNSQALWGCYETVPSIEIAELFHERDSDFISVVLYEWDGKIKKLAE